MRTEDKCRSRDRDASHDRLAELSGETRWVRLYAGENDRQEDRNAHRNGAERPQTAELIQRPWQTDHKTYDGRDYTEDDSALRGIREGVQELGTNDAVKG